MGMMLYQPHVPSRNKFCQLCAWYIPLHALACFRLAHWVSIPGQYKCRYVNVFERRSCIVTKHPKHTSSHDSRGGLKLEASYKIKFLPSFGASKTAAFGR